MSVFDAVQLSGWEVVLRLATALGLGIAIGVERELDGRDAGIRTHALLCLGCAVFGVTSVGAFADFVTKGGESNVGIDVSRIASYVVAGVGFLAGGTIIKSSDKVKGLTTAASLWVTSAIGLATGLGFYIGAIAATVAALVMLLLDRPLKRLARRHETVTLTMTVASALALSDVVAMFDDAGAQPKQVRRASRADGAVEFVASGIKRAASDRVIGALEARNDVVELALSTD